MNEKFGQFDWKCRKDEKPDENRYIYAYFPALEHQIFVGIEEEFTWDEHSYWCYVFIPAIPKIERSSSLEERIIKLETMIDNIASIIDPLR